MGELEAASQDEWDAFVSMPGERPRFLRRLLLIFVTILLIGGVAASGVLIWRAVTGAGHGVSNAKVRFPTELDGYTLQPRTSAAASATVSEQFANDPGVTSVDVAEYLRKDGGAFFSVSVISVDPARVSSDEVGQMKSYLEAAGSPAGSPLDGVSCFRHERGGVPIVACDWATRTSLVLIQGPSSVGLSTVRELTTGIRALIRVP